MNSQVVRMAVAAGIVWYALGMPGLPPSVSPSAPYAGSLTAVHSATRDMVAADRQGLAEALAAAGRMLADDRAGLIKTTEDLQKFVRGTLAYGYSSFSVKKYPASAAAIQAELERVVGDKIEAVTPEKRAAVASMLEEAGRATR